jgi:hypothetical protein
VYGGTQGPSSKTGGSGPQGKVTGKPQHPDKVNK